MYRVLARLQMGSQGRDHGSYGGNCAYLIVGQVFGERL